MECRSCGYHNPPGARFCANCGATLIVVEVKLAAKVAAPAVQPAVVPTYSGFWLRFAAFVLDSLILSALWFVVRVLSLLPVGSIAWFGFLGFFSSISSWLYFWLFTGLRGQTPGKMILGIKVTKEDGDKVGLGYAALREIVGKMISAIVILLGFLWIAWDPKKQGWHDMIAGTIVVNVK